MYHTLPDVAADDRIPTIFLLCFSAILLGLVTLLALVALSHARARKQGIYRKYVAGPDQPTRRRTLDAHRCKAK